MAKMRDIDRLIAAQKATITRLMKEIERREHDVQTLLRARTLLAGDGARLRDDVAVEVVRGGHPKKGLLDPDSDPGRARAVLEMAGQSLHVNEILKMIEEKYGKPPKRTSLVGALSRYSKQGLHFMRTAPNTFGLIEWRTTTS